MNNDTVLKAIALLFPTMNWIAMDSNWEVYIYVDKPYLSDDKWDSDSPFTSLIFILPYTNETDWTKTLVNLNDYRDVDITPVRDDDKDKKEFIIQYVLNRANTVNDRLNGVAATHEAIETWEIINNA